MRRWDLAHPPPCQPEASFRRHGGEQAIILDESTLQARVADNEDSRAAGAQHAGEFGEKRREIARKALDHPAMSPRQVIDPDLSHDAHRRNSLGARRGGALAPDVARADRPQITESMAQPNKRE